MRQDIQRRARGRVGIRDFAPDATGARDTQPQNQKRNQPSQRANLYDEVTARIIAQLEEGRFPWVQPWSGPSTRGGGVSPGLPRNAVSGRSYSGVNVLILWGAVMEHAYPSQGWLTFRQAVEAGGNVRRGERGVTVVYADRFTPEAEKVRARDSGEDARSIPFLKRFTVFNVAQCEGLPEGLGADPEPLPERQIAPLGDAVIKASGVEFHIGGERAFYVPSEDYVQVPPPLAYHDSINWYRTALHEL
uniref:ArdC family protein n=1 Tax=Novosphingobium rosa TaxID=76978 RepID=UPI000A0661B5